MMKTVCTLCFSLLHHSVVRQCRQEPWSKLVRLCVRLPPWPLTFFVSLAAGWRTVELLQKLCKVVHQRGSQWFSTCTNSVSSGKLAFIWPTVNTSETGVSCAKLRHDWVYRWPWVESITWSVFVLSCTMLWVLGVSDAVASVWCLYDRYDQKGPVWLCDGVCTCLYVIV